MGKTSNAVHIRYRKKAFDQVGFLVPKGRRDDLNAYAQAHGTTVSELACAYFRNLLGMTEEEWKKRTVPDDAEDTEEEEA